MKIAFVILIAAVVTRYLLLLLARIYFDHHHVNMSARKASGCLTLAAYLLAVILASIFAYFGG